MRYDKFCLRGVRFLIREPGTENAVAGNQMTDANKNANFNAFFNQTETLYHTCSHSKERFLYYMGMAMSSLINQGEAIIFNNTTTLCTFKCPSKAAVVTSTGIYTLHIYNSMTSLTTSTIWTSFTSKRTVTTSLSRSAGRTSLL